MIELLSNIGNTLAFIASIPQIITAYRNRRNLRGLSSLMLFITFMAYLFFIMVAYLNGAYVGVVLCLISEVFHILQFYWKRRYR